MSKLPLPISANVLRVIPDDDGGDGGGGVRVSDVPLLGGVSREGTTSALGFLERNAYVELGPDPSGRRGKFVRPTERGRRARDGRAPIAARVEAGWEERFGAAAVGPGRTHCGGRSPSRRRPLFAGLGLEPYPDGWRSRPPYLAPTKAVLTDPVGALPRHPMVLHRGGYPDGSSDVADRQVGQSAANKSLSPPDSPPATPNSSTPEATLASRRPATPGRSVLRRTRTPRPRPTHHPPLQLIHPRTPASPSARLHEGPISPRRLRHRPTRRSASLDNEVH